MKNRRAFYQNFKRWLKVNRHRFNYEPYIYGVQKNHFYIRLRGIDRCLLYGVSNYGVFNLYAMKGNDVVDIICDFEDDHGVSKEAYERFLEHVNEDLTDETYLYFFKYELDYICEARLASKDLRSENVVSRIKVTK